MPPDQPPAHRTVLLTGAASGLGAHTALLAARRGHTVFAGVREFPMRVKCATLAWHAAKAAIEQDPSPASTE